MTLVAQGPQALLDKAIRAGAKLQVPVSQIADAVTIEMFADPEGNIAGLMKSNTS